MHITKCKIEKLKMTEKEAKKLIDELESIDFQSEEGLGTFNSIIKKRVMRGGVFSLTINPHPDLYFVRARILEHKDDYYETIDDHSYNKKNPHFIKRGRANFDEQPIFYAGRTRITSLAEVNIIQNKMEEEEIAYGLSRWKVKKPMILFAIINPDTASNMKGSDLDGFLDFVIKTYKELQGTSQKGIIDFYKYLSEKFTERIVEGEEHKYIMTSVFTNQIFNALPGISGILYQSVKWPETYNIAIKPEFIDDQYMVPSHFFKQTFKRKNIIDLTEISMVQAVSFDTDKNIVKW